MDAKCIVMLGVVASCAAVPVAPVPSAPSTSAVAARAAGKDISIAEVDARLGDELTKLNEQVYVLRRDAADRLAVEMLVKQAAQRDNVAEDEWLKRKVEPHIEPPTQQEIEQLYEKVKERLDPGTSVEAVRTQLTATLYREARGQLVRKVFEQLKKEAGYELILERPARTRKAVDAIGPSKGPANAPITMVVFSDFQCPFCGRSNGVVDRVMKNYGNTIRLVFRQFPLKMHRDASRAAEASLCADVQGKFWAFHDLLFSNQSDLSQEALAAHAKALSLDLAQFGTCLDSGAMAAKVQKDLTDGNRAGVDGTPAFFINGLMLSGARPEADFYDLIESELKRLKISPK
jgi:protein-disulfide isomerase